MSYLPPTKRRASFQTTRRARIAPATEKTVGREAVKESEIELTAPEIKVATVELVIFLKS
jgi:hypothetical protein